MSVAHDQSCWPVSGSNPSTLLKIATTRSVRFPVTGTSSGVFHDSLMPPARQTSFPLDLFSATRLSLSTLAFTITRLPCSTGDAADPQLLSRDPTSALHSRR